MYHFIINPLAASGKAAIIWRDLKQYIEKKGISYEAYMTSYENHATELALALTSGKEKNNEKTIVVLGGDGTLNEVINGISISAAVTIGYIPAGWSNNFARGMKISRNPKRALRRILNAKSVYWIDYGVLAYMDTSLHHRRFLISSGMGLDAVVCNEVHHTTLKKVFNRICKGRCLYVFSGLYQLFFLRPFDCELTLDGERRVHIRQAAFISVHITSYEGGGFCLAPQACPDDGRFEIFVISGATRRRVFKIMFQALFGRHKTLKGVHHYHCAEFSISSQEEQMVHTDGENCGTFREISYVCEKQKLHMIL